MHSNETDKIMLQSHSPKIKTIDVSNVSKSYEKGHFVLKQLNLSVDSSSIYGLLGSSGCGKTTLLSCIVGLKKPDSGQISLFGRPVNGTPGPLVGYMPQEIALYDSFTIRETFNYFGNLTNMPNKILEDQIETLVDILKIPIISSYINTLSGGEKRRVSLAVSMLHNPKLLILDEPTVGVDPLLGERIWEYLTTLVKSEGMTVLVTTHYTEEVRNCNKVGFLRRGRLLVEEEPKSLLNKFNTNLLQNIMLDLCRRDEAICQNSELPIETKTKLELVEGVSYKDLSNEIDVDPWKKNYSEESDQEICLESFSSDFQKMKGLVKRNWINIFRHIQLVFMLVMIPIVHILLGVYVIGKNPTGLNLAIVGNQNAIPEYCGNQTASYTCRFMKQLEVSSLQLETHSSETDALQSVTSGRTSGYLIMPHNFTQHFQNRLIFRIHADNETLVGSTVQVRLDMSQSLRVIFLVRALLEALREFTFDIIKEFGVDPRFVEFPLKFNAIYGSFEASWRDYFLPNFIVLAIFILQTAYGLFHIQDKKNGTLQRTLCTGVTHFQVYSSYVLSTIPILVTQIVVMLLVTGFEVEIAGSWYLIFLQSLLVGLSGTMYGLMCGSLFDHEMEGLFGILFMFLSCQAMGGLTWPLDDIDWRYRLLCYCLPLTAPLTAMRSTMVRGWGLSHPQIQLGLFTSVAYIGGCLLIIAFVEKVRK